MRSTRSETLWALLVVINFLLVFTPTEVHNYDAENHLFFASHYAHDWFSPWASEWFAGGFSVWSYAPLSHQLISLLAQPLSLVGGGIELAYRLVVFAALLLVSLALPGVGRIFKINGAAWLRPLALLCPSVLLAAYGFGQLPTLLGMGLSLTALPYAHRYLVGARWKDLCFWLVLAGTAASAHHYTVVIILPVLVATVAAQAVLEGRNKKTVFCRLVMLGSVLGVALIVPLLPYWWWYVNLRLPQTEITHPSRYPLSSLPAFTVFVIAMYGPLVVAFPRLVKRLRSRVALGACIGFLAIVGLGHTTPIPHLVFGPVGMASWLTYDRFATWAALLLLLPLAECLHARSGKSRQFLVSLVFWAFCTMLYPFWGQYQPQPTPVTTESQVVSFLDQNVRGEYRYVTFGFGEAGSARLSRLARDSQSIDGTYYTGRSLRELRESGLPLLDSFRWHGQKSRRFVEAVLADPRLWHLKYAVSHEDEADVLLARSGWQVVAVYGEVNIWEYPGYVSPVAKSVPLHHPRLLRYWWGITPLAFLVLSLLGGLRSLVTRKRD